MADDFWADIAGQIKRNAMSIRKWQVASHPVAGDWLVLQLGNGATLRMDVEDRSVSWWSKKGVMPSDPTREEAAMARRWEKRHRARVALRLAAYRLNVPGAGDWSRVEQ